MPSAGSGLGKTQLHAYGVMGKTYSFAPKFAVGIVITLRPASEVDAQGRRHVYKYAVLTTGGVTLECPGSEQIRIGTNISSAGGTANCTQIGSVLELTAVRSTLYLGTGGVDVDQWALS
jgi:hypothetical protein